MQPTVTGGDDRGSGRSVPGFRPAKVASPGRPGTTRIWVVPLAVLGMSLSACGISVGKHGVSGDVLGHKFSVASGTLPAGFPADVPVPDHSRVLDGGGTDARWDVAFAVTGTVTGGSQAYQAKFRSAGYTVTDAESGSTPVTAPSGAPGGSTSTTLTVAGSTFTAKDATWTVLAVAASTTASTAGALKAGEFAINITVLPSTAAPPSG